MLQSCMVMYGLYANYIKVKDQLKSMRQPCGNMSESYCLPSRRVVDAGKRGSKDLNFLNSLIKHHTFSTCPNLNQRVVSGCLLLFWRHSRLAGKFIKVLQEVKVVK